MTDGYPVPATTVHKEQVIRRSRFVTSLASVSNSEAARVFVAEVRSRFPDAHHHCWAFVAGPPGATAQVGCSDDGEPAGTAGQPMLKVLLHSGVGEIAAVVTRYFGGTKLGRGGLVRAYAGGVQSALAVLETEVRIEYVGLDLVLGYPGFAQFQRTHAAFGATVENTEFSDQVKLRIAIPAHHRPDFVQWFSDLTHGQGKVREVKPN